VRLDIAMMTRMSFISEYNLLGREKGGYPAVCTRKE
jgi:hypothetical protein